MIFLLGFDLMKHWGAVLDLKRDVLVVDEELIPVRITYGGSVPVINRVSVAKRVVVPPRSVRRVTCKMDDLLND